MGSRHAGDELVGSRSDLQRPVACLNRPATTGRFSRTAVTAEALEALYPPMVMSQTGSLMADDQAVLAFLQHLDLVLAAALRGDEPHRLGRLTMIHALVMALLADPQELDQALRQAAARLAELDS
jgi:hypothetical protein